MWRWGLHDQLNSSIFFHREFRKEPDAGAGSGMAAAASPESGPGVQMGDGPCPGKQPGPLTALHVTI